MWAFIFIVGSLTNDIPVDKAAHFGVSHSLTHLGYELCAYAEKPTTKDEHLACSIVSSLVVFSIGLAWENAGHHEGADISADILGIGTANALIHLDYFAIDERK